MSSPTIIVVEDEPDIRELIGLCLSEHDFTALLAEDGEQAPAIFEQSQPELVILDVQLPGMDGVGVCHEIRRHSNVPVLFLTCKHEADDVVAGLEAGGDDYITKPFDLNILIARVRANLRRVTDYSHTGTVVDHSTAHPNQVETPPPTQGDWTVEPLTTCELELLFLIKSGLSNQEIADKLHLILGTVKGYNNQIYSKLGVKSRTQAIVRADELKLC